MTPARRRSRRHRPEGRDHYCARMVPADAASVLDIGCGHGAVLSALTGVARRVGVDVDGELIAAARRTCPDAAFEVVDGAALPFQDDAFDAVVLSEVLEHVGHDRKVRVVDEALRVLRPGGRLIITAPHRGPFSRLDPLDFKRSMPALYGLYRRRHPGSPKTAADVGHVPLTLGEIEALLQGRCEILESSLGGPLSPVVANVMVLLLLLRTSDRTRFRWARLQDGEQSLPAPPFMAHAIRMTVVLRA